MPNDRPAQLRLFVAIELPEAWKQALQTLQSEMQHALEADSRTQGVHLRWVRPEGTHLTLKFLGEVSSGRLPAIQDALSMAVPEPPGVELSLGRTGSFADQRAPRVIWTGIAEAEPGGQIRRLVERVETWLAAAGFPREQRAFTPHLTLARLPNDLSPSTRIAIAEVTTGVRISAPSSFTIDCVSLMQSHLGPGGARYERLAGYPA